jgi:hypothetical protein
MKKLFLLGCLLMSAMLQTAFAMKIAGVKISIERGTKEWNADRTAAVCIGRGLCILLIEANVELGSVTSGSCVGELGYTEDGKFGLMLPSAVLTDKHCQETFAGGSVYIGKDIELGQDIRGKLKNCPSFIRAGSYRYIQQGNEVLVLF